MSLTELGYDDAFAASAKRLKIEGDFPARVCAAHKGGFALLCAQGRFLGQLRGKLRLSGEGAPVVGDWVLASRRENEKSAVIHAVFPRRTAFARQMPGGHEGERQVLAANADVVFLVSGLDQDFNLRRIERYLSLARESGAAPVVVLTKTDVAVGGAAMIDAARTALTDIPVHVVSAVTGEGLTGLAGYFRPHRTVLLLGSSGVGKSTLANALLGGTELAVGTLKSDGKGRHTTSRRDLKLMPAGGMILDTPGLREVQLLEGSKVQEAFDDIVALAPGCRFGDCRHITEPGCAVRAAADSGQLVAERYDSFLKLQSERDALAGWKVPEVPAGKGARTPRQRKHDRRSR